MLSALSVAQIFLQLHDSLHTSQKGTVVGATLELCPGSLCCGKHICVTVLCCCGAATVPWGLPRAGAAAGRDLCSFTLQGLLLLVAPMSLPSLTLVWWVHQDSSCVLVLGVLLFAHSCLFPV